MFFAAVLFIVVAHAEAKCPIGTIQGVSDSDCYVYHSKPELWFKADEDCMSRGGHLASVSGRLMNSILTKIGDNYCASEHWLGAGWNTEADNKWVWTDGTRFQFTNWASGNPTSQGTLCVSQDATSGLWYSKPCRDAKAYICRIPGLGQGASTKTPLLTTVSTTTTVTAPRCPACPTCGAGSASTTADYPTTSAPGGWVRNPATSKCYRVMRSGGSNATASQQACAAVSGTLPSIHSMAENEWIAEFYKSHTTGGYWGHVTIGLYNDEGSWNWYDGSDYDFVNWAANEPQDGLIYATFYTGGDSDGVFGQWYGDNGGTDWDDFLCQVASC